MVDVTPGDSGANKGFWREQLRDRFGKFVEMGGAVLFDVELPGVSGKVQGLGIFIGNAEPGIARIEVKDNKKIPRGVYLVKPEDITAVEAILPDEAFEAEPSAETPLKTSMTGSEALALRLKSMGNLLREDGRFPTPRMSFLDRKDSDNRRAAQRDYKKVFDAEPALQEKYKTFENMWEQVYRYGTDERSQSPNVLADIPEDMKELNRAYAKHFLGLQPDGLITFYRNAVNGKDTPEESAVGYASTDALMAYDYNSHHDNVAANGRYEIDAKPDEIFGMLGYSKIEDEYGVTIGRELANIPGRVRRVGDLALVLPEAPWLKEWGLGFNRGKGASPFRQYTLATSHDFHAVEPFGESLEEFFTKYNLSAADIKKKFDQIYGEGAYDRYKATGNSVSFQRIRDLFVKLDNGQIGLDVKKLENLNALTEVSEYTGDLFDNTLKMLSVFQELTGQYFMTHKTRDYAPPPAEDKPEEPAKPEAPSLPPKPREAPIPEGHVRLFHYTNDSAVESIRKNGLQAQKEGAAVADDNVALIWAAEGAPINGDQMFNERPIVEFHVPEEVWAKGAGLGFERIAMAGPVNAENIVAVHEPWHFYARDALENTTPEDIIDRFGNRDLSFIGEPAMRAGIEAAVKIARETLAQKQNASDIPDYSSIDYKPSEFNDIPVLTPATPEQDTAMKYYTGDYMGGVSQISEFGHSKMNMYLRSGEWYPGVDTSEEQQKILSNIASLKELLNSTTINEDIKLIRYQSAIPDGLDEVGGVWNSAGFLSTSAFLENGREVNTAFTGSAVTLEINIPKGSRGGAVFDSFEAEVILPPGSKFIVQSVEKINFRDTKIKLLLVGQDG